MKVLLFTHKNDIDGMGSAILAKLAFNEVEYVLCETFDLKDEITKYFDNGKIYYFHKIFVTDLWPDNETLARITSDDKLKDKFFVFDHHKTSLDSPFNKSSFATVKISIENKLCCGTSLFYDYLVDKGFIYPDIPSIKHFVELTRRHDTWEWKNVYSDEKARELSILFDAVGQTEYIQLMVKKLSTQPVFAFNELERFLIDNRIKRISEKCIEYSKKIHYTEILGLKAGILFIEYEYRNEIAEYFRENYFDMDFAMFIAMDRCTVSYRSVKDNVNVRKVAEHFGGKGHDKAATNPISDEKMKSIIETLTSI